jgi:hypothetical protein
MSITSAIAVIVLCNAAIPVIYLAANVIAGRGRGKLNWLPWMLLVTVTSAAWLLHERTSANEDGPKEHVHIQGASNVRSPAAIPGAVGGDEQVEGQSADRSVDDNQPNDWWSQK